jgi:FkbH-like protein
MESKVEPFNKFNIPRAAQLTQRSNQFNLRTIRYTEEDINKLAETAGTHPLTFTLEDKFGNNGLICIIILKVESKNMLFIDTWLMSCRVLKRGMENFVLNTIVEFAKHNSYELIKGEYLPTSKNEMVKNHYSHLGFMQDGKFWMLNIRGYEPKKCFIIKK